jgi:hypothetical protein
MSSAGFQLVAGRIPGERLATTIRTSDSSGFTTTETVIDSVTAALVSGRTYRVRWVVAWASTVSADTVFSRLREDNLTGTQLQLLRCALTTAAGAGTRWVGAVEAEYTAVSSGNKTFVGTGVRVTGTGTITAHAASTYPIYLYVDYIRG